MTQAAQNEQQQATHDRSPRIARLQERYQTKHAFISSERAQFYTDSWRSTEDTGLSLPVRVAMAMKNVFDNMSHYLDPDDRIAGYWTEYFLGIPIPIERGEYNKVLEAELTKASVIYFRTTSAVKGLAYMLRKRALGDFLKNQRITRATGSQPLNVDFKTMSEREINNYQIERGPLRKLKRDLLPYWNGRCLVDLMEKELASSGLLSHDMNDFTVALPGNTSRQVLMLSTCATIATIQGHVILDYTEVLGKGLDAMKSETTALLQDNDLDDGQREFLKSIEISLDGVISFANGIADRIELELAADISSKRTAELKQMLEICRKVPFRPPETFREAVQAMWTVKTAIELALPVNLQCFGRLDQILYPYYKADLEAGRITADEARDLLAELLLKIMSQNIRPESNILSNFYHRYLGSSPVTVGGVRPDGEDGTNDLTYLFIEAAHDSKAVTNLSVRVNQESPACLLEMVGKYLHDGTSSYSIYNDEIGIEAMRRRGFELEDARDYAIMGCVEMTCPGRTGAMSASALQLNRLLDITMRNGDSRILAGTIKEEGIDTGDPDQFAGFDDFIKALIAQGKEAIAKIAEGQSLRDRLYEKLLPSPYISTFMQGCLVNKKDVTAGGAKYDLAGISMVNSIANMIDSLLAIKKLVYEQKKYTIAQVLDALDNNFAGQEQLHRDIINITGKWGNGDAETDRLAHDVTKQLFDETFAYTNHRGGPFVVYVISMITHTIDGRLSIASADGRRAATPYAASCNPYNVERSGVTAALRSVSALPFEDVMGAAVNVKFHPSAIGSTSASRKKWASLIRTYFKLGGAQMQPTVASAELLKEAQQNPEQHRDLIVKVGGYSTYFIDLGCEIQNEIIERTEHLLN
jgi:pyruvate-formate lyase